MKNSDGMLHEHTLKSQDFLEEVDFNFKNSILCRVTNVIFNQFKEKADMRFFEGEILRSEEKIILRDDNIKVAIFPTIPIVDDRIEICFESNFVPGLQLKFVMYDNENKSEADLRNNFERIKNVLQNSNIIY